MIYRQSQPKAVTVTNENSENNLLSGTDKVNKTQKAEDSLYCCLPDSSQWVILPQEVLHKVINISWKSVYFLGFGVIWN